MEHFQQQIKINNVWIALELALLGTRSKFGQFVLTFNYICKFTNLMMTPIKIMPFNTKKPFQSDNSPVGSLESQLFSDDDRDSIPEGGWYLGSETRKYIPSLNLEKPEDIESKFTIELQLERGLRYSACVDYS